MNVETVVLDEKEYIILDKIKISDIEYYILVNSKNIEEFCIRKKITEDGEYYLVGLENETEFNMVMKKYKDIRVN